jgi:hypothetical protein
VTVEGGSHERQAPIFCGEKKKLNVDRSFPKNREKTNIFPNLQFAPDLISAGGASLKRTIA